MNSSAEEIARALRGSHTGNAFLVRCPVPTHGKGKRDRHPSLRIRDGDLPGRLLVHCYAGCDRREVLDALRALGHIQDCSERNPAWVRRPRAAASKPSIELPHEPDAEALALWRTGSPAAGTIVPAYLKRRGIIIAIPLSIRFAVIVRDGRTGPAMIVAVQRPDGKVVAVQHTLLTWSGAKADVAKPRHQYGQLGHGAVRRAKATDVLGLAEGVETALAAMQLTGVPCWASLGSCRMHNVEVPGSVLELHIFVDDDKAGHEAALRLIALHTSLGRRVVKRIPPAGVNDYAEVAEALCKQKMAQHERDE
jgi:putative DNA primase/helicase